MRVLVTGATGFLGGHLIEEMVKGPHVPVCAYRQGSDTKLIDELGLSKVQLRPDGPGLDAPRR